ncbi:hypothetical protein PG994_001178 [Apiospora phragmitis]|uniref:Uncharacterized protein n=1 Tax=Apiospora phragmitis TaxID=2905665 RepID=A0ABR1WSU6_9PEZI
MATDKYLDLSKQRHQPDLEPSATHPYHGIEVQSYPALAYTQQQQQQQWAHQQSALPTSEEKNAPAPATDKPHRRILGLTVPVFWGLLILLVLVVAGAIGGGLAAQGLSNKNNNNADPSGSGRPSSSVIMVETASTPNPSTQPPASGSGTVTMLLPIVQALAVPLDGGCPKINGTRYSPRETTNGTGTAKATATGITLQGQASAQAFVQLCNTNFPEGDAQPGVRDILSFYAPTFEQCMTSCAQYNRQYQRETGSRGQSGIWGDGFCMAVSIVKYCKLLNPSPSRPWKENRREN